MADIEDELERLKGVSTRVTNTVRADPTLPAGFYGDMEAGFNQGISHTESYTVAKPRVQSANTRLNQAAILVAKQLKDRKVRARDKGFWTDLNNWLGGILATPIPGTGKVREQESRKFTDRVGSWLEFTQHLTRTAYELDYQAVGGRAEVSDILGHGEVYFNPKAWSAAWRKTREGNRYFFAEEEIKTELPEFGRTLVKEVIAGKTDENLAQDYQLHRDVVSTILESPIARKYRQDLEQRKVTVGRAVIEDEFEKGSVPYTLATGAIDFAVAIVGEPDFVVGEALAGIRAANRFIPRAAEKMGGLDAVRHHPKMQKFLEFATKETSASKIVSAYSRKGTKVPVQLAEALSSTADEDVAWEIIKQAASGINPEKYIADIPQSSVWAKVSGRLMKIDVDADSQVKAYAARRLRGAMTRWGDEPRSFKPQDIEDSFHQIRGVLDTFPKAFSFARRQEILDEVAASKSGDQTYQVLTKVIDEAGEVLKIPTQRRKPILSLFNSFRKLRSYNISTDTGDELSTKLIETANGMIRQAVPHGYHEGVQKIPLWSPKELRELRWAQGSFTKYFLADNAAAKVAKAAWLAPSTIVRGVWVPLMLITRPLAYPLRIQIDNQLRLMALGKGFAKPSEHLRSIRFKGEFGELVDSATKPSFLKHPVKYVQSLGDWGDDIPDAVAAGKSQLLRTATSTERGRSFAASAFEFDEYGVHGWQEMALKAVQDPVGRQLLQGRSIADVSDWLTTDGRPILDDLLVRKLDDLPSDALDDVDTYVESWVDRISQVVHGNEPLENLMRSVSRGDLPISDLGSKRGREFLQSMENPPIWITREVGMGSDPVSMWHRAQEVMFRYIIDIPDGKLSRLPFWQQSFKETESALTRMATESGRFLDDAALSTRYEDVWRNELRQGLDSLNGRIADPTVDTEEVARLQSLKTRLETRLERGPYKSELDKLAAQDGFGTFRSIQESAKSHAANTVIAVLYDPTKRNRVERALQTQFPFLAAWREFVTTWAGIMGKRPENIGRAGRAFEFLNQPVEMDHPFFKEGFAGKGRAIDTPIGWLAQKLTGTGTTFTSDLESLNLVTQNFYPSFGPVTQFIGSLLARKKPEWEETIGVIGGSYGMKYARGEGLGSYMNLVKDTFLPAWMRTAALYIESPDTDVEMARRTAREFQQMAIEEYKDEESIPWQDKEAIEGLLRRAEQRAKNVVLIQSLGKMIWPGTLQMNYPHQPLIDRIRVLKQTMGEDEAIKVAIEEVGPGAQFLEQGLSVSDIQMPPTAKARKLWNNQAYQELAKEHGGLFWALMENEVQKGEPFDYEVWKWQFSTRTEQGPIRKGRKLGFAINENAKQFAPGWVESAQIDAAWRRIDEARKSGETKLEAGEINQEQFNETMKRIKLKVGTEFPAWAASQVFRRDQIWNLRNLHRDMTILADRLKNKDSGKGLGRFVAAFESAQTARERVGLSPSSFEGTSVPAVKIRMALKRTAERIAEDHPDFRPFYMRHLRFFLEPEGAEVEEPILELMEAANE